MAVVRLSRGGRRFEVACYKNKMLNWRNGVETDLSEVLQIDNVFSNVSKGVLANKKHMVEAFGTDDPELVIKAILDKGSVQVSEKERKAQLEGAFRDVATIISEKCVNPESNRPYTVGMIESAMRELHVSLHPSKAPKAQALEIIPRLMDVMPIARASMELRAVVQTSCVDEAREAFQGLDVKRMGAACQSSSSGKSYMDLLIDPGLFRAVEEAVQRLTKGAGRVEVLRMSVLEEGAADIAVETARKERERQKESPVVTAVASTLATDPEGGVSDPYGEAEAKPGAKGRKGKKAKRREKEEAVERQARVDDVAKRREERAAAATGAVDPPGKAQEAVNGAGSAERGKESKLKCNTCCVAFDGTGSYREHFKSDWHRYNLKLKMKGMAAVPEQEFASVDCEAFFSANLS